MPLEELEERENFRFYKLEKSDREKILVRIKEVLSGRDEVVLAVVFGSFISGRVFRDIDIGVYVKSVVKDHLDYKFMLEEELSSILGYPVDVKVLNEAPPGFLKNVLINGKVLVERIPLIWEKLLLKAIDEEEHIRTLLSRDSNRRDE